MPRSIRPARRLYRKDELGRLMTTGRPVGPPEITMPRSTRARQRLHRRDELERFGTSVRSVEKIKPTTYGTPAGLLGILPTELMQEVARLLPVCCAACLALTCRSIYNTLGSQYWQALDNPRHTSFQAFLRLLLRDLPSHFICDRCHKLHRSDLVRPPGDILCPRDNCLSIDKESFMLIHPLGYRVDPQLVRLVSERLHYGEPHGVPPSILFANRCLVINSEVVFHLLVKPIFITTDVIHLHVQMRLNFPPEMSVLYFTHQGLDICSHRWAKLLSILNNMVDTGIPPASDVIDPLFKRDGCQTCGQCVSLHVDKTSKSGIDVVIERWTRLPYKNLRLRQSFHEVPIIPFREPPLYDRRRKSRSSPIVGETNGSFSYKKSAEVELQDRLDLWTETASEAAAKTATRYQILPTRSRYYAVDKRLIDCLELVPDHQGT
ncbi:MAG: hypothetical protein M4579_004640 [Chaenotheca gracillima]|nr:MAG: hypothetical protein M4579_004640 [Chaenotheca gracillima]